MTMILTEIRVGGVQARVDAQGRTWRSAIAKVPAPGPVRLGALGLAGDAVGNRTVHGGPDQAVLAYAAAHYARWQAEGVAVEPGAFGENFLLDGLEDEEACIGDLFAVGQARVQVSHPRQPCATLARHLDRPDIVERVWTLRRGGWYLRVLQEGLVEAGQPLRLLARPNPGATVARVLSAQRNAASDPAEALALAGLEGLSAPWAERLAHPR
ncbi:MOSC domain-containing protein [Mesoterricola sediminis]|uniref:Molybdenum cofactor biosynthesis protein n=1 Tax=Mesoterricola sediminis TaxID=2927980 RepID=A0AA48HF74_9BACT|nr:MOSC domain-containing protein [Mesoterricola sediminis]BDU77133.1 molybdenum cofactor biosynthesis protein [Mesoterricola sediminis]